MTVLDLSGYDALLGPSPPQWLVLAGIALAVIGVIVALCLAFHLDDAEDNPLLYRTKMGIFIGAMVAVGLGVILMAIVVVMFPKSDMPAFSEYVNEAYGFESSDLPDHKPEDGSLPVTWKKDDEIHSGTLSLLDNEISIKETNGDYLEVQQ